MSTSTVLERPRSAASQEPWLGLTPYGESDAGLFFGREKEAGELLRLIKRSVLTVVFGPSGTGKTSLLNAGLFPLLRKEKYLPIAIRLDHSSQSSDHVRDIRRVVARELKKHDIEEASICKAQTPSEQETLWEYLHRVDLWDKCNQPITPVLIFDQFEEAFTLGIDRPGTQAFLRELADIVENYMPASVRERIEQGHTKLGFPYDEQHFKVLLSLREDFVCRLDGLRKAMPSVMQNRFALERMKGGCALEAVLKPAGGIVDDKVARRIIRLVAASAENSSEDSSSIDFNKLSIEPALLSVVCRELNARRLRDGRSKISVQDVAAGEGDILSDFYERSFEQLHPQARIFVEDRLLTASGFRGTVPMEDAIRAGLTGDDVSALIDRRLVRSEERLGIPHLELTHDVLTKVVRKSRNARQERERRQKEEQDRAVVEEQRKKKLRQARRLVIVFSCLTLIFLLMGIAAGWLWLSARKARADAERAHSKTDAALSTVVDLGDAFEDKGEPLVFEGLAADLTDFADIPFIAGRVRFFKGLSALAGARKAKQDQDDEVVKASAAQALKSFQEYRALASNGLSSDAEAKRDLWKRELGKAEQAIGDANRYLHQPAEALASYALALKQFDDLEARRNAKDSAEDSALDRSGLYVRMAEASLDQKETRKAVDFCEKAENVLTQHFKKDAKDLDPHIRYAFQRVNDEFHRSRSLIDGVQLDATGWVKDYLEASQSSNVSSLRQFFDEMVAPYFSMQTANWDAIAKDKEYFFRRFPVIHYTLVGTPAEEQLPDGRKALDFDQRYVNMRIDGKTLQGTSHLRIELRFTGGQWKIAAISERKVT